MANGIEWSNVLDAARHLTPYVNVDAPPVGSFSWRMDDVAEAMATPPDDSTLSDPPSNMSPVSDQGMPSPQSVAEPLDTITVEIPQKRARSAQASTTPARVSPRASSRTYSVE